MASKKYYGVEAPDLSTLTISSGVVTLPTANIPVRVHKIAGEGGVADALTGITGGNAGELLVLLASSDSVDITVTDGGTLYLQADFVLDSDKDTITLLCTAANTWVEVTRASNA